MLHKRWICWLMMFVFILAGALSFQSPVSAKEVSPYIITDYKSNISLHEDGSAYFDEVVSYQLLSDGVKIIRPIPMAYSSSIEGLEVFKRVISSANSSEDFEDIAHDFNFEQTDAEADIHNIIIVAEGSKRDELTFVYRYKLQDTVFLYTDTAAFYWQFFLPEQNIEVNNVLIEIAASATVSTEELSGFVRGAAHAEKELLEDGVFRISSETIREGEFLESVLLMPTSAFPNGRKIVDNPAKDEIVTNMSTWEEEAAISRQKEELRFYGGWGIAAFSILLSLGVGLVFHFRTRSSKKKNISSMESSQKGIPDPSITPAELGLLMNGKLSWKELFATVLSLIKHRFLELRNNSEQDGVLTLRADISKDRLKAHEEYVLNWLTGELGDGIVLPVKQLDKLLASYSKDQGHKISTWESLVRGNSGKQDSYTYENIIKLKVWAMVGAIFSLAAAVLVGWALNNQLAGILSGVLALTLIAYVLTRKKVNEEHKHKMMQWEKYKDELYTNFSDKSKPLSLAQWEEHFVYAIPLGIADEMLDKLIQVYDEHEFEDGNLTILYHTNYSWLLKVLRPYRRHFK
jgi:uncharacterized membrane protein